MIKTEIDILRKENEIQSEWLHKDDEIIIDKIMGSMSILKVNSFDAQVIYRDLIGMAREARLRKLSLKHVVGDDFKKFADEIISNSRGPSISEILSSFITSLCGFILFWVIFEGYASYGNMLWKISLWTCIIYISIFIIYFILRSYISPMFIMKKGWKRYIPTLLIIIFWISFLSSSFTSINNMNSTITINPIYILIIASVTLIISGLQYKRIIHRLAKDNSNYIQDLQD